MTTTIRIGLGVLCLAACQPASATLLVEGRTTNGGRVQTYTFYMDGPRSRMGGVDAAQFVLMDWRAKTLYIVDTASKQTTDMSISLRGGTPSQSCPQPEVDAVLEFVGRGPTMAGYATAHYIVKADGQACEEIFASKKAMGDLGESVGYFRDMQERDDHDTGRSKCDIASDRVADPAQIGWPLKTITLRGGGKGQVDEVLRIEKGASVPAGFFSVPAGYRITKAEELYPGMAATGSAGSALQLPCPSLDEYDDYDADDSYADEEFAEGVPDDAEEGDLVAEDEEQADPTFAHEVAGAAVDEAKQTTTQEVREKVKDTVSKNLKKVFGR